MRAASHTAVKFTENLALQGITPSIGSVGDAYDNALMESSNGLDKTECIGSRIFTAQNLESIVDVELATMAWVQWHNHHRLHSTLGMVLPHGVRGVLLGQRSYNSWVTCDGGSPNLTAATKP